MNNAQCLLARTRAALRGASYGDPELGVTSALIMAVTRDSEDEDKEDFRETAARLIGLFPNDVEVVRFRHWGVGWIDYLKVRVLNPLGNPTSAGKAAWEEVVNRMDDADEHEYGQPA